MDEGKARFLFGEVPAGIDVDDPDERAMFFEEADPYEERPAWAALRSVIANQIADDTPAEVWQAARDLVGRGIDRAEVLEQLTHTLAFFTRRILAEETGFDEAAYVAALHRLPLPDPGDAATAVRDAVLACQGIDADRLVDLVLAGLARKPDDVVTEQLVGNLLDDLIDDGGPLVLLAGDRMVQVGDLTAGTVMTHRLSEAEAKIGIIAATPDLAPFGRIDDLTLSGGARIDGSGDTDDLRWAGPEGWLGAFSGGDLLAFRLSEGGVVSIAAIPATEEPRHEPDLVARLRAAYDRAVEQPWLPIDADELVYDVLLGDRTAFHAPQPPLADLCEAAGLQRRGNEVAHEQSVWDNQEATRRMWRVMDRLESREEQRAALAALEVAPDEGADAPTLRAVLNGLRTPEVLSVVVEELLGSNDSQEAIESTGRFAQRLLHAAKRPPETAVARWLACVVAERRRDPVAAEVHLRIALNAAPGWDPAVDRAAWYASDRGDARTAAMLWRSLDALGSPDLEIVEQFEDTPRRLLARNQPCWCGSGRKYKNCHLNRPDLPPLPDRVAWIWRKAAAFLERRGGAADLALVDYAHGRVVDPDDEDDIFEVLDDPIVIDCALTEGGWFQRFLDERGALLPEDEAMLVTAWMLVKRSVYEIADVRPGTGVTVRDIATGDRLEVRDRPVSEQARHGELICARVVPDGESHQFIGGMFPVVPGRERDILARCEEGRGYELCEAVAAAHRPPVLPAREGESRPGELAGPGRSLSREVMPGPAAPSGVGSGMPEALELR
ncbi:MAG TPA: SEC-C domain-containing protein [Actinomycetota bacterium]